jgi:hypothetical protein
MIAVENNWPNWLVLLSFVLLLKGVLEKQYRSGRHDQSRAFGVSERMAVALERFGQTILANQEIILASIKDSRRADDDIIINAIRDMATASNKSTGSILLAIGRREELTVMAIEGLVRAIRDDLAALRMPPPVGDTRSQVKDSAKGGAP